MSNTKKKILHRYQIARGHLEKVVSMLESDSYCIDIVHQSLAVQAALKKADDEVLKNHLETCVSESIREGNSREAIGEVMQVLKKR
jgi:CsoR family transcriptional regulator, copper-sensing transcriptional repressor